MTKRFDENLLEYFGATDGAYSVVTSTEYGDSQVTVTGYEKSVVLSLAEDFLKDKRGGVASLNRAGISSEYTFRIYPTGEKVDLNLLYPKLGKEELRLYLRKGVYAPSADKNWCVFIRDNELWLGSFDQNVLTRLPTLEGLERRHQILEPELDDFQTLVNANPANKKVFRQMLWGRNPAVSKSALIKADYKCEIFPDFPVFEAKATLKPYLECHHLVPMKLQDRFESSLDVVDNICALNPYAHRLIHHGVAKDVLPCVRKLSLNREKYLKSIDFDVEDLLSLYT